MLLDRQVKLGAMAAVLLAVGAAAATLGHAEQGPGKSAADALPNPYRAVSNWATLPEGRVWGSTSAVAVDKKGNVWVAERCGANSCVGKNDAPIFEFDPSGKLLKSLGGGMFALPHGIQVDADGNVWVSDTGATAPNADTQGRGYQVVKFNPDGKVLMTLGKAGVSKIGPDTFIGPNNVFINAKSEIFVMDGGHGGHPEVRVVKFSKDGKFIESWGKAGKGPGEFDMPHAMARDSKGRLFLADLNNNRVQILDENGRFLDEWRQFGRPNNLVIVKDILYVADGESNSKSNPGYRRGIRIGSALTGVVTALIPDSTDQENGGLLGVQGVAVDANGTVYGAEVGMRTVKKYIPSN
jgi:hypothetical protein